MLSPTPLPAVVHLHTNFATVFITDRECPGMRYGPDSPERGVDTEAAGRYGSTFFFGLD